MADLKLEGRFIVAAVRRVALSLDRIKKRDSHKTEHGRSRSVSGDSFRCWMILATAAAAAAAASFSCPFYARRLRVITSREINVVL